MNRAAGLAGVWYPGDGEELHKTVEDCVECARQRYGEVLGNGKDTQPVGIVVPHAGLAYSGVLAGLGFGLVRAAWERVDRFVLFGTCHRMRLRVPAVWPEGVWETPMGGVEVDALFSQAFLAAGGGEENCAAHQGDNSLEMQLPFIRALFPEAKIVPIAMGFFENSDRYGEIAAAVAREKGGVTIAVGSTDLTHYGASFGVMPAGVGEAALAWARENDERFLNALTHGDLPQIVRTAERDGSACGAGAAAACAGWARALGCPAGRILAREDSSETTGDAHHFVGYGAVAFEKKSDT